MTRFIGRESEIAELRRLLLHQRLVTLVGPSGAGKTRLALAVAATLPTLHFTDLATVVAPELCARALADPLGLRQEPGRPLLQTVGAHLRHDNAVVLMDNLEHVIEAAADLAGSLLRVCPRLTILATSRVPLEVPGEAVWSIPPMSLPKPDAGSVAESHAGRLFIDRARLVTRGLQVDAITAPQIAAICAELDGLPLGIELAAGQEACSSSRQSDRV